MSAAERASEASKTEQAKKLAVRANERTDERVAQYSNLYSCLFWPTVRVGSSRPKDETEGDKRKRSKIMMTLWSKMEKNTDKIAI